MQIHQGVTAQVQHAKIRHFGERAVFQGRQRVVVQSQVGDHLDTLKRRLAEPTDAVVAEVDVDDMAAVDVRLLGESSVVNRRDIIAEQMEASKANVA